MCFYNEFLKLLSWSTDTYKPESVSRLSEGSLSHTLYDSIYTVFLEQHTVELGRTDRSC